MTQIAATDKALVRLLEGCDFPGVSVMSAPHEWDHGFVTRLLGDVPALLVAFVGGEAYDDTKTSTALDVAGKWSAYCVVGWHGAGQEERRLGAGAGFDLMHRAAAVLHTATLFDENGERLSQVRVEGLGVETDSSLDISESLGRLDRSRYQPSASDCSTRANPATDRSTTSFAFGAASISRGVGKDRPATAADAYTDSDLGLGTDLDQ